MGRRTEPIVLDRHWDVSSLLGATFKLFWHHKALFLTITAIVVVPVNVLLDVSVAGEAVIDETGTEIDGGALLGGLVGLVLFMSVVPGLVTALHVVSVLRIAEGTRPTIGEALALAGRRAGAAIGASVLYLLCMMVGLVLLIIPGIYLGVRLYFAAQAAVVDEETPLGSIDRSAELTKGRWWQTFGRLLLAGIVFALVVGPLTVINGLMDYGVAYVVLNAIAQTISMSLTALFGTLVFMDYHGHRVEPAAEPAAYGGFEPPQPPTPQRFG